MQSNACGWTCHLLWVTAQLKVASFFFLLFPALSHSFAHFFSRLKLCKRLTARIIWQDPHNKALVFLCSSAALLWIFMALLGGLVCLFATLGWLSSSPAHAFVTCNVCSWCMCACCCACSCCIVGIVKLVYLLGVKLQLSHAYHRRVLVEGRGDCICSQSLFIFRYLPFLGPQLKLLIYSYSLCIYFSSLCVCVCLGCMSEMLLV